MIRLIGRLTVILTILIVLVLFSPRVRPYDDGGLHELLSPPDCKAPCLLGIRPNVTTRDEAVALLEAHPWVGAVVTGSVPGVLWTWNGSQPAILNANTRVPNTIIISGGVVTWISVVTDAPLASTYLLLGAPDEEANATWGELDRVNRSVVRRYYEVHGRYRALRLDVSAGGNCPLSLIAFWSRPVTLAMPMDVTYPLYFRETRMSARDARICD